MRKKISQADCLIRMIKLCPFIIEDIHADSRLWIVVRANIEVNLVLVSCLYDFKCPEAQTIWQRNGGAACFTSQTRCSSQVHAWDVLPRYMPSILHDH